MKNQPNPKEQKKKYKLSAQKIKIYTFYIRKNLIRARI